MNKVTRTFILSEVMPPNWISAINIISNRFPVERKLSDDEDYALWLIDRKWQIEMLWAAYYYNPVIDRRFKPFNLPEFQTWRTSGKKNSDQLRLTTGVWDRLPQHQFLSPMAWWVHQMIDCKKSDYRHVLEQRSEPRRKKEAIKSNRLQVRILKGIEGTVKDQHELIDGFCEAIPAMGLLLRKAMSLAKNSSSKKGKSFITQYWKPYLSSVQESIEYSDRGARADKIQLIHKLEDNLVYLTAPRRPVRLLR
ncbi:MAG: hypothetical protein HC930_10535 [Hydrococcus sp. SU_1_0]|nr:hypothetical protein [Hydrococcus sp. SU_1_0]